MIGRKCRVTEPDGVVWVGRVVACQLSPRVVVPETETTYGEVLEERWRAIIEDGAGKMFAPSSQHGRTFRLLPPDDPTPLDVVESIGGEE